MYAIAPLTVAFAIAMLADGTASSKEFRSPSKGTKITGLKQMIVLTRKLNNIFWRFASRF
jgi:hypothetical protein